MAFGYIPDFAGKSRLADWYLRWVGYPYAARRYEAKLVLDEVPQEGRVLVLDLGCGDGVWTNDLARREGIGWVAGLDYSSHDIGLASTRAKKLKTRKVSYFRANAQAMPFASNSFDAVFSISTLEHIQNDQATLGEARRVLKPGGVLAVSMPTQKKLGLVELVLKLPQR